MAREIQRHYPFQSNGAREAECSPSPGGIRSFPQWSQRIRSKKLKKLGSLEAANSNHRANCEYEQNLSHHGFHPRLVNTLTVAFEKKEEDLLCKRLKYCFRPPRNFFQSQGYDEIWRNYEGYIMKKYEIHTRKYLSSPLIYGPGLGGSSKFF